LSDKNSKQGYYFTYRYKGITRHLITPAKVEPINNKQNNIEIKALWDTGATFSLITQEVAIKLNLKPISKIMMSTPSDKNVPSNVYLINLYLPNNTMFPNLQVAEGVLNGCDMLIGMDVIINGDFAVTNNNGRTTFSFRMPSMVEIDFVKHSYLEPVRNEGPKTGRNDTCPCGSGKKYKHCCGK
jgi:predicted aspartyl protease